MLICVEGIDRSGKDTLILNYDKLLKWSSINLNRGPVGKLFYDKKYNRESAFRKNEVFQEIKAIQSTRHIWIFIKASPEVIFKRLQEEAKALGTEVNTSLEDIKNDIEEYYKMFCEYYNDEENRLVIDTTNTSKEECALIVKNFVAKISNNQLFLSKNKSFEKINARPTVLNNEYIEYNPIVQYFNNDTLVDDFNKSVDEPYYNMLEHSLNHLIHLYNLAWINKRQIIYTSPECIPLIQIIPGNITKYIVVQRSMNVKTNGLNDILFFKYFNEKAFKNNFEIYYICSIPHEYN